MYDHDSNQPDLAEASPISSDLTLDRRTFLTGTTALLALPIFAESHVLEPRFSKLDLRPARSYLMAQLGHSSSINSARFSPDGQLVVTAGKDSTALLWERATGNEIRRLQGHTKNVFAAIFSPDSRSVVTASGDLTVRMWDALSGAQIRQFKGHKNSVVSVDFSATGDRLLTGSMDGSSRIWEVSTGKEIQQFRDPAGRVSCAIFSPDNRYILTTTGMLITPEGNEIYISASHGASPSGIERLIKLWKEEGIRIWEVKSGKSIHHLSTPGVLSVAFSKDGRQILGAGSDANARIWNFGTGKRVKQFHGHSGGVLGAVFSLDNRSVLTASDDNTARLWDTASGAELRRFSGHTGRVHSACFSPGEKWVLTGSADQTARLWNAKTAKFGQEFKGYTKAVQHVEVSPDGRYMLTAGEDGNAYLWDATTGRRIIQYKGHSAGIRCAAFSSDAKHVVTSGADNVAILWETDTGREIHRFTGHTGIVNSVVLSPDGGMVLTASDDKTTRLWNAISGKEIRKYQIDTRVDNPDNATQNEELHSETAVVSKLLGSVDLLTLSEPVHSARFSSDGMNILTADKDGTVRLWETQTGRELQVLHSLEGVSDLLLWLTENWLSLALFSPNDQTILTVHEKTILLRSRTSGKVLYRFKSGSGVFTRVNFSFDGKKIIASSSTGMLRIWDSGTGQEERTFAGHADQVNSVAFSYDAKWTIVGSNDGLVRVSNALTGQEACRLISFSDGTWAVTDPEGRYDASNGGDIEGLHWVVGNQTVALKQLKERYYDPGLLAKVLGFNRQPFRNVQAFDNVKLYPRVEAPETLLAGSSHLTLQLTDQGGGIGRVEVYVNDALYLPDARPQNAVHGSGVLSIKLDVSHAPTFRVGQENAILIIAYNNEGWLASRGVRCVSPRTNAASLNIVRHLYALVCGISDYSVPELQLNLPAHDAEAFASALQKGAFRLFGATKTEITLLSSSGSGNAKPAIKANLLAALTTIRSKAHPDDIVVLYLAGHGVALSTDNSLYCYLTQEANSADTARLTSDIILRRQTTVTSAELADWMTGERGIKANYRVLILDTCAAGAFESKLTEKREVSGDQIRALDRFKDRAGFHVLMGCAADKVSYEASRYGHGLLTYALLEGMKGPGLLQGDQVDVRTLFGYCEDEVLRLAGDLGGIQQPRYHKPGAGSFPIGLLAPTDRSEITLAAPRPLLLRPHMSNKLDGVDDLYLTRLLRNRLLNDAALSARGDVAARLGVYVDADELSGALVPYGQYTVSGNSVMVTITLLRDSQRVVTFPIEGQITELPDLIKRLAQRLQQESGKQ